MLMGLESELLLVPRPASGRAPLDLPHRAYDALLGIISSECSVMRRSPLSIKYFFENGGACNYESHLTGMLEGLFEISSPECSNPRDVALWSTRACGDYSMTISQNARPSESSYLWQY